MRPSWRSHVLCRLTIFSVACACFPGGGQAARPEGRRAPSHHGGPAWQDSRQASSRARRPSIGHHARRKRLEHLHARDAYTELLQRGFDPEPEDQLGGNESSSRWRGPEQETKEDRRIGMIEGMVLLAFLVFFVSIVQVLQYPDPQVRSYSYKTVFAIIAIFEALSFVRIQNEVFLAVLVDPYVGGKESVFRHMLSCLIFFAWFLGTTGMCWVIKHEPDQLFAATGILSHICAFVLVEAYADVQREIAEDLKAKHGMRPVYALYCVAPLITAIVFFFMRYHMKLLRKKIARTYMPTTPSLLQSSTQSVQKRQLGLQADLAPEITERELAKEKLEDDASSVQEVELDKSSSKPSADASTKASSSKASRVRLDEPSGSDAAQAEDSSPGPKSPDELDSPEPAARAKGLKHGLSLLKEANASELASAGAVKCAMLIKSKDFLSANASKPSGSNRALEKWMKAAGVEHYTDRQAYEHWMAEVDESENQTSASVQGFLLCRACYCISAARVPPVDCEADPVVGCNEYPQTYWTMCVCILSLYLFAVLVVRTLKERYTQSHAGEKPSLKSYHDEDNHAILDNLQLTLLMAMSWGVLVIVRWTLNDGIPGGMTGHRVVNAFAMSPICIFIIIAMDKLADLAWISDAAAEACMKTFALCLGLEWEKAVAAAINVTIQESAARELPVLTQLVGCSLLAITLLPAWMWFIVPDARLPVPPRLR